MRSARVSFTSPLHRPRPRLRPAVPLGVLLAVGLSARGLPGQLPPTPDWPLLEPLSSALVEELRGREVYSFDDTLIGTLASAAAASPRRSGNCDLLRSVGCSST